ncbi:MAG: hypothetical protein ACXABY_30970 [Candidatus Thorarchaeota archaeon]|jgi:hypothetical protein
MAATSSPKTFEDLKHIFDLMEEMEARGVPTQYLLPIVQWLNIEKKAFTEET